MRREARSEIFDKCKSCDQVVVTVSDAGLCTPHRINGQNGYRGSLTGRLICSTFPFIFTIRGWGGVTVVLNWGGDTMGMNCIEGSRTWDHLF